MKSVVRMYEDELFCFVLFFYCGAVWHFVFAFSSNFSFCQGGKSILLASNLYRNKYYSIKPDNQTVEVDDFSLNHKQLTR